MYITTHPCAAASPTLPAEPATIAALPEVSTPDPPAPAWQSFLRRAHNVTSRMPANSNLQKIHHMIIDDPGGRCKPNSRTSFANRRAGLEMDAPYHPKIDRPSPEQPWTELHERQPSNPKHSRPLLVGVGNFEQSWPALIRCWPAVHQGFGPSLNNVGPSLAEFGDRRVASSATRANTPASGG